MFSKSIKIKGLKKFYILLVALFVLVSSCQRSQFSTTTRQYKNGKVTYVNNYHKERNRTSKGKSHKNHLKETEKRNSISAIEKTEKHNLTEPKVTEINPVPIQDLIASTSNEPLIIELTENQELINAISYPDTFSSKNPKKEIVNGRFNQQIIKFKNGHQETVKIISQSHDTLYFALITEPKIVRGVLLEQIDTILQDSIRAKADYHHRTEKLGLIGFILSFIGLIPMIGIPFAIIGVLFGVSSLKRMHRYPGHYKRKGLAIASLIIGSLAFVGNIILIIFLITGWGPAVAM
jgi:hypothetical protein